MNIEELFRSDNRRSHRSNGNSIVSPRGSQRIGAILSAGTLKGALCRAIIRRWWPNRQGFISALIQVMFGNAPADRCLMVMVHLSLRLSAKGFQQMNINEQLPVNQHLASPTALAPAGSKRNCVPEIRHPATGPARGQPTECGDDADRTTQATPKDVSASAATRCR